MDALTTSNVYLEMPYTQYASDIETILNAEHDAIMTMSETVDEGIQNMNDQVPAVLADKAFSAMVCGSPSSLFSIPIHFPMTSIGKKPCPSGAGMHSARPAHFLEKLLYFRERRLFYGECCCPE